MFLTLILSNPHASRYTRDPNPNVDSAGTLKSASRTSPSDILYVEGENFS